MQFCNSLNRETPLSALWSMARRYRGEHSVQHQSLETPSWISAFISRVAPPFKALPPLVHDPDLVLADFSFLEADVSFDEIKLALKLSNNSAAGLDKIKFDLTRKISDSALRFLLAIFLTLHPSLKSGLIVK